MRIQTSHVDLVHRLFLVCRQFEGAHNSVELARTDFGAGSQAAKRRGATWPIAADSYAIGIYGKYGANIDSLGLICGKSARIANPPPPLTSDPNGNGKGKTYIQTGKRKDVPAATGNGKTYIQTGKRKSAPAASDNSGGGDAGGGQVGGKTFRGTVNQPSAIYDAPDGNWKADLSPGDRVTIIE